MRGPDGRPAGRGFSLLGISAIEPASSPPNVWTMGCRCPSGGPPPRGVWERCVRVTAVELIGALVGAAISGLVGHRMAASSRDAQVRKLQQGFARADQMLREQRRSAEELDARLQESENHRQQLQRALVEIPEVAQRLAATRDVREVPQKVLELVEEVYRPLYSAFYRVGPESLVAIAVRGECEWAVGHRVKAGEGVMGICAMKQLPYTPEEMRYESGMMRGTALKAGVPERGFSVCLPVTSGTRTLGVILVGPCERPIPHWREVGRTIALITSVVITSAAVLKEQRLLAKTDGLTGLLNRKHLLARVNELLGADPAPRSIGFFLFDIDHFKHYNDTNGHLAGDELLISLSRILRDRTRDDELVGRYGGEEFLMVMPDVDREGALRASERVRALIAGTAFPHGDKQPGGFISISGGVATWPADGEALPKLLRRADEALYAAKRAGRNRVLPSAPELPRPGAAERVAQAVAEVLLQEPIEVEPAAPASSEERTRG